MTQTHHSEPSLSSRLDDTVTHVSGIAPPDLFAVFGSEQRRLVESDDAAGRIAVGQRLPQAKLPDASGSLVPVHEGDAPAVLVFYRGAWCPYCNVALGAYQRELLPELERLGVSFVAISPQGPDGSTAVAEANALSFPVLSDRGGLFARFLGLSFDLAPDVVEAQLAFGNDFATINADGEWSLPHPTVLVVDAAGVVRFVDVQPDYTRRTEPAAILEAVRRLG